MNLRKRPIGRLVEYLAPRVLDIGARGGVDEDLLPLSWATEVIGFEPDHNELSRMLNSPDPRWKGVQVLPFAIGGASGDATLYVPESPQGASLLPHNDEMVDRFGYPNLHVDVEQIPVRTESLDALKESGQLPRIDYIKIDVEGAELSILESGGLILQDCSALKVEGSFLEQRIGQPLVWEVVQRIIDAGFEIVEMHDIHRWRRRSLPAKPYVARFKMPYSRGQISQCDLIALRSPGAVDDIEQALRLIVMASALGFFDYAISVARAWPAVRDYCMEQFEFDLENELQLWSRQVGRVEVVAAIASRLRDLIPLSRSLIGGLPHKTDEDSY